MGALSKVYVNPAIAGDSGTGTLIDPYGDLQYALTTMTFDSTNGTEILVVPGTAEVPTGSLSFTFTPDNTKPLVIRSSIPGTLAEINGNNGNFTIYAGGKTSIIWRDIKLGNTGTATALTLGAYSTAVDCEVHTAAKGIVCSTMGGIVVRNCYIHDIGEIGIENANSAVGNYLANGAALKFTTAITVYNTSVSLPVIHNIIFLDGSSSGIFFNGYYGVCYQNSILSAAGTGKGIYYTTDRGSYGAECSYNLVEGFSGGAGGVGISVAAAGDASCFDGNACYNNIADYSFADQNAAGRDNETTASLGATPFAKSGANTFANRLTYFAPANVGAVRTGGLNGGAKGAVPAASGYTYGDTDPDKVLTTATGAGHYAPIVDSDTVDGGTAYGTGAGGTGMTSAQVEAAIAAALATGVNVTHVGGVVAVLAAIVDTNVVQIESVDATDAITAAATVAVAANKTGYSLAATGLDAITATEPTGKPTTFPGWIMWLVQRFRRSTKSATAIMVKTEAGATVTTQTITSSGDDQTLGPPS